MSGYSTGETADLFDPVTGNRIGVLGLRGQEQLVPYFYTDPLTGVITGLSTPTGNVALASASKNTLMFIGDSWAARSYSVSGNATSYPDVGIVNWAQCLSANRLNVINPSTAVGGTKTSDWTGSGAYQLSTLVAPYTPGWVVVMLGINDVNSQVPYATIVANLQAIYDQIRSYGAKVVCMNVGPYGPTYVPSGGTLAQANALRLLVNAWIANYASTTPNAYLLDAYSLLVSPSDTSGNAAAADMDTSGTTGLHASASGARKIGTGLAAIFNQYVTDSNFHVASYVDSYDYDTNAKNRISNPLMLGTGGTTSQGTGTTITATTIPTSWTVGTANGGTSTVVSTTAARTVATDGDAIGQNCSLAITGTNASDIVSLKTGSITGRFAAGDTVYGEMYVKVTSATNLQGIRLLMTTTTAGGTYVTTGMSPQATYSYDSSNSTLVIRTPNFTFPATPTSGTVMTLDIMFAGAGGATVTAGRAAWRKVN